MKILWAVADVVPNALITAWIYYNESTIPQKGREFRKLTVEYCLPEPTVRAPDGAVARLAAKTAVTKDVKATKKRMMNE